MIVRKLKPTERRKAAKVLSASFFDYPLFTFYFPRPVWRKRHLPWYFRNILNSALRFGEVYTTPTISGVIFTLSPEHTRLTIREYVQNGFLMTPLVMGLRNYLRSMKSEAFTENTRLNLMKYQPHLYLWGVGVAPDHKQKGIGSALIMEIIKTADESKLPIYLETHNERNVPYYQKHGFDLIQETTIPNHNLPLWCMMRQASV